MLTTIKTFLLFILGYHVFVTIIGYGILDGQYIKHIAILKDLLRVGIVFLIGITHIKYLKEYRKKRKYVWISFMVFLIFAISVSLLHQQSLYSIFVGLKYSIQFIIILLTATIIGHILANTPFTKGGKGVLFSLQRILISTVLIGFLWQFVKYFRPELLQGIGYGPIGDFVFGTNPPMYYRTGPLTEGGIPRRQGIFAGPNNYGYFLVSMLPLILLWWKPKMQNRKQLFQFHIPNITSIFIIIIWFLAIGLTLSRTALIGGIIVLALTHKQRIKQHKKIARSIFGATIIGLITLSILKGGSTIQHITNKRESIQLVIHNPTGFGLGTAGPAVHHQGTVLPENFFLQLMVDIGTIGFILWTIILFQIMNIQKKIFTHSHSEGNEESKNTLLLLTLKYMSIGRTALLIMGLFLHVFEDSMVNYLFFVPYGILLGYLYASSKTYPKKFWEFTKQITRN